MFKDDLSIISLSGCRILESFLIFMKKSYVHCSTVVKEMWEGSLIFIFPFKLDLMFLSRQPMGILSLSLWLFVFTKYLLDIYFIILCQFFMAYFMFFKAVDSSFFYSCQFFLNFLTISVLLYCCSSSGKSVTYLLSLRCH